MAGIELDAPGTSQLYMGNEAIARGVLEAGVGFAAAYPGTPSSEIMGSLAPVAEKLGFYAEWSINEKVAMEAAAGASFSGIRAIASMKQNGVNVIADFIANLVKSGTGSGGLVLVSCDDPSALSSSNEQDTRNIAKSMDIPLLEPGSFQEAKDMTKYLFELSEELGTICMLRSVTRVSHARGNVKLGELPKREHKAYFDQAHNTRNPLMTKFAPLPGGPKHGVLHEKLGKAQKNFETSPFNWYEGPDNAELIIITCGSCYLYSKEAIETLQLEDRVGILKLGTLWPLPEKLVEKCLNKSQKVLVVEDIDPFLEHATMELVASLSPNGPRPIFYGKRSGHINAYGEQNPDTVIKAVASIMDLKYQPRDVEYGREAEESLKTLVPNRSLAFCPGCPHRATWWVIKNALKLDGRNGVVTGDIGCYSLAMERAGYYQIRLIHGMGSGIGIANGLGRLKQFGFTQPVFTVLGDSTFFHAAIPALINGVWNKSNFILFILDNGATAMTGFQPHPGTGVTAMGESTKVISIESLCRSLGTRVEVCDPFDFENSTATVLELMNEEDGGAKVVIMRRGCELIRARTEEKAPYTMRVDLDKCLGEACGCGKLCLRIFRCPGLIWDNEAGKAQIDDVICCGCGVCTDVCPQGAIIREAV